LEDKRKILLIEDNPGDAKLVEIYLRESPAINFDLVHVTRLSDGLQLVQEDNKFDILLLDLSLPDSRGFDTLTRAMEGFPNHVSIVVLTGLDDENVGVRAVAAGAQDFLVKGQIDTSSLTRAVLHAIKRNEMLLKVERTAKELKISEERLVNAQSIARIGNYELAVEHDKMYWSDEIYLILGLDIKTCSPTLQNYLAQIPINYRQDVESNIKSIINGNKESFTFEHILLDSNGNRKHLRNQGQAKLDENGKVVRLVGTIQDISDYKTAVEMLIQSQERYRTIFEESQDAIYIINEDGRFEEHNNSLGKMLDYTDEDLNQLNIKDLFASTDDWKLFKQKMNEQGAMKDFEVKLKRKNNEKIDCLITSTLWQEVDGVTLGYHGIIRDVTALKRTQALIRAKEVAENSARLKEQFLANMSHEIRTPMNVVVGMTHLLENTALSPKQMEYLNSLKLSSDTLLRLINNILDFSRIESGKLELEQRPFKIQDLINDLIQTYKFKAREKGITMLTQTDAYLPETIVGDSVRLHQIINNLVSNAIKYTHEGEITLKVIVIGETDDEVDIKFSVQDTGIGIALDKQGKIFESFTQAAEDTTRLYGGSGLGLSIASTLVDLFDGNIGVKSKEGEGSTFFFNVKLKKYHNNSFNSQQHFSSRKPKAKSPPNNDDLVHVKNIHLTSHNKDVQVYTSDEISKEVMEQAGNVPSSHVSILLVEDHKLNQIVATDLLKRWSSNINITIAENGKEAIDTLKKNTNFDVILMDISMPIMDGYATTEYIRNEMEEPVKSLPIIAMTAHAFNRYAERCFAVGMNEFVSKPINNTVLCAKLNKVLAEYSINKKDVETAVMPQASTPIISNTKKIINLEYLDSLTGGESSIKLSMLDTLVSDLPKEIAKVQSDYNSSNWEQLKQSSHKIKSTCAYIGLNDMVEVARNIEHGTFEKKNYDKMGAWIADLAKNCKQAHIELQHELNNLRSIMV